MHAYIYKTYFHKIYRILSCLPVLSSIPAPLIILPLVLGIHRTIKSKEDGVEYAIWHSLVTSAEILEFVERSSVKKTVSSMLYGIL